MNRLIVALALVAGCGSNAGTNDMGSGCTMIEGVCLFAPTTIAVRDATVGPLSGTTEVSGTAISTASYGTPSSCETSCGKIVLVPWPISVEALRTRILPSCVNSMLATLASLTSPLPVNPAPCQASARPMPDAVRWRLVRACRPMRVSSRTRSKPLASAARSSTSSPPTLSRRTWPVGVVSPSR